MKKENKGFLASTKFKVLTGVAVASLMATNVMAEVIVDPATGKLSGDIDISPFMSGVAVILTALAAIWCVKKVISLFNR